MAAMRYRVVLIALVGLSVLVGAAAGSDSQERYRQHWAEREDQARNADSRIELAGDLLDAAQRAEDPEYKLLLSEAAHRVGARHIGGYASAAAALDIIQHVAPDRRLWALDELRRLYETAYKAYPHKLRLGTGLADVCVIMAEQRADDFTARFEADQVSVMEANRAFASSVRDLADATGALRRVIRRAKTDAARVRASNPDVAESLTAFAEQFEARQEEIESLSQQMRAQQTAFQQLAMAEARFERAPDVPSAQNLAAICVVEFDRPELVSAEVCKWLPEQMRNPMDLVVKDPAKLTGDEADMLARWYLGLAESNRRADNRANMLLRARVYRQIANERGVDNDTHPIARIDQQLFGEGLTRDDIEQKTGALGRRLTYQFGVPQATEVANADDPDDQGHEDHDPVDHDPPVEPQHDPDEQVEPDAGETVIVQAPSANRRAGGRPMVTCDRCSRRFFPGWGVNSTTCGRCESGAGNIFSFGQD